MIAEAEDNLRLKPSADQTAEIDIESSDYMKENSGVFSKLSQKAR